MQQILDTPYTRQPLILAPVGSQEIYVAAHRRCLFSIVSWEIGVWFPRMDKFYLCPWPNQCRNFWCHQCSSLANHWYNQHTSNRNLFRIFCFVASIIVRAMYKYVVLLLCIVKMCKYPAFFNVVSRTLVFILDFWLNRIV